MPEFLRYQNLGAVLSTGANAGQVRGPVQLTFGRSDPIVSLEHSITCMAVATEAEAENKAGITAHGPEIYRAVWISRLRFCFALLANQTGFSEADLELLWEALENMFEHDRLAARGLMGTRKLIIFKHTSKWKRPSTTAF